MATAGSTLISNAGQIGLGIVGGIIGAVVGGPAGAAYGLQLGLAVGTVVSPTQLPGTFGPRLSDNKTTTSQLGAPIVELWGTDAVAGTVIWLGDVVEHANTEEVGGKGGPEGENTTYTYTQSIAVGLCRGPQGGVLRIWENGKLAYDVRDQQPGESINDYTLRIGESISFYGPTFTLYLGDEDQLPDPTIELKEGLGNVPAYRGLMYIVYHDRLLRDDQGQRHPNFKFEVSSVVSADPQPLLAMVATVPGGGGVQTFEPYALLALPSTLADPLVTQFEDTNQSSAVEPVDICGKASIVFAIGQVSQTQHWARVSFDSGASFASVLLQSTAEDTVRGRSCDMGPSGRLVVAGDIEPADTPVLIYSDNNGGLWLPCATAIGVESDFRFALVRYLRELDIWLCGGYRGIAKSTDGFVWVSVLSGVTGYDPRQFVSGDGTIAALRYDSIAKSTDGGETWATVYSDGFSQRALAFGNGVWVRWDDGVPGLPEYPVFDAGFSVATELAGPWGARLRPDATWQIRDIAYDGTQFVAVGFIDGVVAPETLIAVSADGVTWEIESQGAVGVSQINRVHQLLL